MGKDSDLLEAARNGNLVTIDKILSNRQKRTSALGPLASLRRSVNPNCHDQNGYTGLHHAALNGHREAVELLLRYNASCTIMDNKGCFPLHLAAWAGHADICKVLLSHGPSLSKVNEQNHGRETALHSAAQYGHYQAVQVLLQFRADPTLRNNRDESPLDLAAQYGRLEVVRLLVHFRPELLFLAVHTHSPLHLAARNGHRAVCQLLIDAGFHPSCRTDTGTALHEAALCGKAEVVRLLLRAGVDVNVKDVYKRSAFELVRSQTAPVAHEIKRIITDFQEGRSISSPPTKRSSVGSSFSSLTTSITSSGFRDRDSLSADILFEEEPSDSGVFIQDRQSFCRSAPPRRSNLSLHSAHSLDSPSRLSPPRCQGHDRQSLCQHPSRGAFHTRDYAREVPPTREFIGDLLFKTEAHSEVYRCLCKEATPPVPPRRSRSQRYSSVPVSVPLLGRTSSNAYSKRSSYTAYSLPQGRDVTQGRDFHVSPNTPRKPARRKTPSMVKPPEPHLIDQSANVNSMTSSTSTISSASSMMTTSQYNEANNNVELSVGVETDNGTLKRTAVSADDVKDGVKTCAVDPNANGRSIRPPSQLSLTSSRSANVPLSPTGYQQPPTPDHPPPSPGSSVYFIGEHINPKEQRRSRDSMTITDFSEAYDVTLPFNKRHSVCQTDYDLLELEGDVICQRKSPEMTSFVDEVMSSWKQNDSAPGDSSVSKSPSPHPDACRARTRGLCAPPQQSRIPRPRSRSRETTRSSGSLSFEPVDEMDGETATAVEEAENGLLQENAENCSMDMSEEWAKIADIMAEFGEGISKENTLLQEIDAEFCKLQTQGEGRCDGVGDWLQTLGLRQYENTFVTHGFDDVDFLGPNVIENSDLIELGIENEDHRRTILDASVQLPYLKPICDVNGFKSVSDWLESLRLQEYLHKFESHNFGSMERVINIWELELNTVLDISTLGHRKRILASLYRRPEDDRWSQSSDYLNIFDAVDWTNVLTETTVEAASNKVAEQRRKNRRDLDAVNGEAQDPEDSGIDLDNSQSTEQGETLDVGRRCYQAQYLGSSLVRELIDTDSTREAISKLKFRHWRKLQSKTNATMNILLAISNKGVQFLRPETMSTVCEHDIANIFCACQDGDHLNYFAYITKDLTAARHYCHVFCVKTTELATDVILALGEAFEEAYENAMNENKAMMVPTTDAKAKQNKKSDGKSDIVEHNMKDDATVSKKKPDKPIKPALKPKPVLKNSNVKNIKNATSSSSSHAC